MAGLNTAAQDAMLDAVGALVTHLSLHVGDPGAGGTAEVFGGAPEYARQRAPWGPARAGVLTNQARVVFDVPGGTTITHVGYWGGAGRGAAFFGSRRLDRAQTFASQGTFTIDNGDLSERTV